MRFIGKAWRGEERLWKVFWIYYVLGSIAANLIGVALGIGVLFLLKTQGKPDIFAATNVGIGVGTIYSIWILVALWRCSQNATLGSLVRAWVILSAACMSFGLIGWSIMPKEQLQAAMIHHYAERATAMPETNLSSAQNTSVSSRPDAVPPIPSVDPAPKAASPTPSALNVEVPADTNITKDKPPASEVSAPAAAAVDIPSKDSPMAESNQPNNAALQPSKPPEKPAEPSPYQAQLDLIPVEKMPAYHATCEEASRARAREFKVDEELFLSMNHSYLDFCIVNKARNDGTIPKSNPESH